MEKTFKKCAVSMFFSLLFFYSQAQFSQIKILDSQTKEVLPFVNVVFEGIPSKTKTFGISNHKGLVDNKVEINSYISISSVGYKTLCDTILPGRNYIFMLIPVTLDLGQVVITGQYTPELKDKSIYHIGVINQKELTLKGANNLADALSNQRNFRLKQDPNIGTGLSLSGLSGEHVKILIDGVPVIGRMDGKIDLGQVNLKNVNHIEIIDGPMSVIYGSNALAGAINIISKENPDFKFLGSANAYLESVGIYNFDATISHHKKKHTVSLTAGRNFFNGYTETPVLREMLFKPKVQYNTSFYWKYSLKKLKLKYNVDFFDEYLLNRGNLMSPYFETAFDSHYSTKRLTNRFHLFSNLWNKRFVEITSSYSYYNRSKQTYFKDLTTLEQNLTTNDADHDTTTFNSFLFRGTLSKSNKLARFNYQLGFDLNHETGKGKRILGETQSIGDYATFLSFYFNLPKNIQIQPGIRYAYNTRYNAPLVYSTNLRWETTRKAIIRASFSKGFRAPSIKELHLNFIDINHYVVGNPELKAEHSNNFQISGKNSFKIKNQLINIDAKIFYNHINNIITLASTSKNQYTYLNLDVFKTLGADLGIRIKPIKVLELMLGYAETGRYTSLSNEPSKFSNFVFSPDFNAEASFSVPKFRTVLSAYYKFTGRLQQFYLNSNAQVLEGFISDYQTLDLSVTHQFKNDRISFTLGGKNLFNVRQVVSEGSAGLHSGSKFSTPVSWGRTMFFRLNVNLKKI